MKEETISFGQHLTLPERLKRLFHYNNPSIKYQPVLFGTLGVIYFSVYIFLQYFYPVPYYPPLFLFSLGIFCIPLILNKKLPRNLRVWFPIYWYLILWVCLPFFFFLTLFRASNKFFFLNTIPVFFWLLLLIDTASYIIMLISGFLAAFFAFWVVCPERYFFNEKILNIMWQLIPSFMIIAIVSYQKKKNDDVRLKTAHQITSIIAHEIRTPLRAIDGVLKGVKKKSSQGENSESLFDLIAYGEKEIVAAFRAIDMILINTNQNCSKKNLQNLSMLQCIEEALRRYPFNIGEKEKINWSKEKDFQFLGNDVLVVHILFNLIKNALYFISAANKGMINISMKLTKRFNILCFTDTGQGIPPEIIKEIFNRFFSTSNHGAGIGLYFCRLVMRNMGGDIFCESVYGKFTQFTLYFPMILKETLAPQKVQSNSCFQYSPP